MARTPPQQLELKPPAVSREPFAPIAMKCSRCRSPGMAYPRPGTGPGRLGVFWCPRCSPGWLRDWAEMETAKLRKDYVSHDATATD